MQGDLYQGNRARALDARARSCYGAFVSDNTQRLKEGVAFGSGGLQERLAHDVLLEYGVVGESTVLVRLSVTYSKGRNMFVDQSRVEVIDEHWSMLAIIFLCWKWFWDVLFMKYGGFRAAVRAAGVLKDARDACRVRRRLLDELGVAP